MCLCVCVCVLRGTSLLCLHRLHLDLLAPQLVSSRQALRSLRLLLRRSMDLVEVVEVEMNRLDFEELLAEAAAAKVIRLAKVAPLLFL